MHLRFLNNCSQLASHHEPLSTRRQTVTCGWRFVGGPKVAQLYVRIGFFYKVYFVLLSGIWQLKNNKFYRFGVTTQIAKIRWAHVGSWWKCGRRRIPTLYQHRTDATMSTILSLLNTTILLQNPLCLYSE